MIMNNLKAKIATRLMGGVAVGFAAVLSMTPMTAFAGGVDTECVCTVKCDKDNINDECDICRFDYTYCEATETAEPEEEHWGPLTPDGNMNLVDDYGSLEAGGKQFITVTSKNGNYFYIIIDRDDNGAETVHFLNLVDEADLLALMDEDEVKEYLETKVEIEEPAVTPTVEEPVTEESEPEPAEPEQPEKKNNTTGVMAVVLIIALGGIGGFLYFKTNKSKPTKPSGPDPDADYSDDDDEGDYLDAVVDKDDLDNDDESGDNEDGN